MIKEYVHENNIILMNFTETWLKKEIQDEKIPNFTTFRADRKGGKSRGGGAAIYLRDGLEAQVLAEEFVDSYGPTDILRAFVQYHCRQFLTRRQFWSVNLRTF